MVSFFLLIPLIRFLVQKMLINTTINGRIANLPRTMIQFQTGFNLFGRPLMVKNQSLNDRESPDGSIIVDADIAFDAVDKPSQSMH